MADNFTVRDGTGTSITRGSKDLSSVHLPKMIVVDDAGYIHPAGDAATRSSYVIVSNGTIALGVFAEDAAHSSGHTGIMPLGVRNDTHTTAFSGTDGDYTPLGLDSTGKVGIRGTFAEDAAHTSGDLGVQVLTVRKDTAAALSGTDGDYQPPISDASGCTWVHVNAIEAGENHIGQVATPSTVISVTPTINTVQFAAGDAVGGKQTLTSATRTSGGVVTLDSLVIQDKGNQKAALTVLIFDSDPSAATITNNSAFAFSTDIAKVVAKITVATGDYVTIDSMAVAALGNLGIRLKASGSTSLYAAVVTSGTPTYASTGDLTFKYGLSQV